MDKLPDKQREAISKMSTGRLVTKLTQFGFTEEQVDSERKTLLDMYAPAVIDGKDKTPLAATATPVT